MRQERKDALDMVLLNDVTEPLDDKQKLEFIYRRYGKKMYTAAYNILKSQSDAEDAVQNAFVNICKRIRDINEKDDDKLRGYVLAIAQNEAYNVIRQRKPETSIDEIPEPADDGVEFRVEEGDAFRFAVNVMRQMDEKYRAPLYLYYVMGYSYKETAKALKRSEGTVRVQISRGLQILKKSLKEAGYGT